MIMIPFNCNLMRHNLFFKVIYTRCVLRKLAQPNPSAFLWEKPPQTSQRLVFISVNYISVCGSEVRGVKGNLWGSHIYYDICL